MVAVIAERARMSTRERITEETRTFITPGVQAIESVTQRGTGDLSLNTCGPDHVLTVENETPAYLSLIMCAVLNAVILAIWCIAA